VVVILVNLTVSEGLSLRMIHTGDVLVGDGWYDGFVTGGFMLSILGEENETASMALCVLIVLFMCIYNYHKEVLMIQIIMKLGLPIPLVHNL
jgi:hypothetical protein